jgi:DNA-binding transcriptional ArsR family regulator
MRVLRILSSRTGCSRQLQARAERRRHRHRHQLRCTTGFRHGLDKLRLVNAKTGRASLSRLAHCVNVNENSQARTRFKTHAAIIKTLAHATRLFILDELSRGERSVRDLTEMIGVEMPTVSRHLSLLKSAGIIDDEKRGARVFYRVRVPCVLEVFTCIKAIEDNRHSKTKPACQIASDPHAAALPGCPDTHTRDK